MIALILVLPEIKESQMLPCLSKQVLNLECPGCGLQRSIALLLQGQFWESLVMYPGLYPMILFFGFAFADYFFNFRKGYQFVNVLGILSVGVILINFIFKIFN
ncbi:MAG: hypothetical protein RLZZ241_801 [Bacteroidota bacterium]|jgi:hypothetical protein